MNNRIFLSPPHMGGNELQYIQEAFASNYIAPVGSFINRLEASVQTYTGTGHAVALSSGTAAIHLALRIAGIGKGDKVAASTLTFIGSVAPILYQSAEPVLIDSDDSWNLDPDLLETAFSKEQPKALIVTHLYGQCAPIDRIEELCRAYGVVLIEDAAESIGATFADRHTGTFGDFGIYSFNGNKIITTSGGGMLVGKDSRPIEHARKLSTQAREAAAWYEHTELGYNYRMSNILAAIGTGQMEVLPQRIEKRRRIFEWYRQALESVAQVRFMPELPNSVGNRWLTTLTLEHTDPITIINALEKENIESRPVWKPMHLQPLFSGTQSYLSGKSEQLFMHGLCLPSGTAMEHEDVARICDIIGNLL